MTDAEILGLAPRRLGNWLVGFGIVGLVLMVAMAVAWLAGLVAMRDLDESLEADRLQTATALSEAADLLKSTAVALESSTASLGTVEDALVDSSQLLSDLADTTAQLAEDLNVRIFGTQPFAGVAASFAGVADELDAFATHTATLASELAGLQPQLDAVASDVHAVEASVRALADRVEAFEGVERLITVVRAYAVLSALIAIWLAILSGACLWVGTRLRAAAPVSAEPSSTS